MKFDTRNKKPKLYNLLLQALFVLLIVILLVQKNAQRHAALISALIGLFLLAAVGQLIAALFKQIQYNPYSYNTIYYMGFSLFLLAVAVMQLRITLLLIRYPQVYQANEILHILLDSAKNFMYYSSPFLLLFSAALCVSNISLIRHEGRRLVNILGILLSFLLVAGLVLLFLFDRYASGSRLQVMLHDLAANIFAAVYL